MKTIKTILLTFVLSLFSIASMQAQLVYHDASKFKLIGKISNETESLYERLPAKLKGVSRDNVWNLGKNTAGLAIRFTSNSTAISLKWTLTGNVVMDHMAFTGIKGLDLYSLEEGKWTFVNTARPSGKTNEASIISGMEKKEREFILYLPLYDGISYLEIGVDAEATIETSTLNLPSQDKPIVAYGTSILQGGCASRPGMAHTNILSRWLGREIINLGFSGNALLDYEIAELMADCDASLYILDQMPNVETELVNERLEKFYRTIRAKSPQTPIIFIENPAFPFLKYDEISKKKVLEKNEALRQIFNKIKESDRRVYFVSSAEMIGLDGEATVDGVHFTDLGFMRYAEYLYPKLQLLLEE